MFLLDGLLFVCDKHRVLGCSPVQTAGCTLAGSSLVLERGWKGLESCSAFVCHKAA